MWSVNNLKTILGVRLSTNLKTAVAQRTTLTVSHLTVTIKSLRKRNRSSTIFGGNLVGKT